MDNRYMIATITGVLMLLAYLYDEFVLRSYPRFLRRYHKLELSITEATEQEVFNSLMEEVLNLNDRYLGRYYKQLSVLIEMLVIKREELNKTQ